jgi:hypothetical protein
MKENKLLKIILLIITIKAIILSFFIPLYIITYTTLILYIISCLIKENNKIIPYLKNIIFICLTILVIQTVIESYKNYQYFTSQILN